MATVELVTVKEFLEARCDERFRQHMAATHHCEEKLETLQEMVEEKFSWIEKLNRETAAQLEKRLGSMNEFRESLNDQAVRFYTRSEHEAYQKLVDADIRLLREARAELKGMASQTSLIVTFVLAAFSAVASVVALIRDLK